MNTGDEIVQWHYFLVHHSVQLYSPFAPTIFVADGKEARRSDEGLKAVGGESIAPVKGESIDHACLFFWIMAYRLPMSAETSESALSGLKHSVKASIGLFLHFSIHSLGMA